MSYLEWLRGGSEFHIVLPGADGFAIRAAEQSEQCRERFHQIVENAIRKAYLDAFKIRPHRSPMDPNGRWDFAAISYE